MKRFSFMLQLMLALVLISSQVSPILVQAEEIQQMEQQLLEQQVIQQNALQQKQAVPTSNTKQTLAEDFSEEHPNQYAVFEEGNNTVSVRVEGYKGQIMFERALSLNENITNAAQATKAALEKHNIDFDYSTSTDYFKGINGESERELGVGSGWMYSVNGQFPDIYASGTAIQAGDVIEWHYINSFSVIQDLTYPELDLVMYSGANDVEQITFNPIIEMPKTVTEGQDVSIKVTGKFNTLDYMYQPVADIEQGKVIDLQGVSIAVNGKTYVTNEQGVVNIPAAQLTAGVNELYFTKDLPGVLQSDEGEKNYQSYPRILRTIKTLTVEQPQEATINVQASTSADVVKPTTVKFNEGASVLDVLIDVLTENNIPFHLTESEYGAYIDSINNEAAGKFGGWDGWMFTVNGEAPEVGMGNYTLKNNDNINVYYHTNPVLSTEQTIDTQTTTLTIKLVGDEFRNAAATVSNWSTTNGVIKSVTLNEAKNEAEVTLKLRELHVTEEAPVILKLKGAGFVGKKEASLTLTTVQNVKADDVPTYNDAEVQKLTEQALAQSALYLTNNAEKVSTSVSGSYSGFWMTTALVAAGIDPAKFPYTEEQSPFGEASSWLQAANSAATAPNTNAGTILGAIHLGFDPKNVKTRDFTKDLLALQKAHGGFGMINEEAFTLLALDLAGVTYDQDKHLQAIVKLQDANTGIWPAWGSLDSTGWALMALAPHRDNMAVQLAIEKAIAGIHKEFTTNGFNNANTGAALISGLAAVGENVFSSKWTDWEGNQLVQTFVAAYQLPDGSFKWKATDKITNLMATEQAIIALADALNGYSSFSVQAYNAVKQDPPTEPEKPVDPPTEPEKPVDPPVVPQTIDVKVSITGLETIVTPQTVTLSANGTALDALTTVANKQNISVSIRETNYGKYVEGINGLFEMQYGKLSGWTYTVNGSYPEQSAEKEMLVTGDVVAWIYSYDPSTITPTPPTEPEKPVDPPTEPEKPVDPPTEPEKPVDPPTEPEKPVDPPTEPEQPVDPPTTPEVPEQPTTPFTDIEGLASASYITELYARGITTGTTATTFSPTANLTRAQFAVMLARAMKLEPQQSPSFTDIQGKWYADAVQALVEANIVQGTSATTFSPGKTITRQQTAVMLFRLLQQNGVTNIVETSTFADAQAISPYAQTAFATLQHLNILTGDEQGLANPHEQLTRQQMAKLLILTLKEIEK